MLVGCVARIILCCIWCFNLEGSWDFVVFCNVENGLPFTALLVVVEEEVERPLTIVSVCCKFVFNWVVG